MIDQATQERLTAIRARVVATTPGTWDNCLGSGAHVLCGIRSQREDGTVVAIADCRPDWELDHAGAFLTAAARDDHRPDMVFMTAAHQDVPFLLDLVDALVAAMPTEEISW